MLHLSIVIYILNLYEFIDFFTLIVGPNAQQFNETDQNLEALNFSSSAIMDNLLVYVIETKRENFSLGEKISFSKDSLIKFINASLSKELNTHQFLCTEIYDVYKFVHKNKIDSILIEKHLGGIMKLDYNLNQEMIIVNLVHNSHFPYLLLQLLIYSPIS